MRRGSEDVEYHFRSLVHSGVFSRRPLNPLQFAIVNYVFSLEEKDKLEDRKERFKEAVLQAYPKAWDSLYGQKTDNSISEEYEQVIPRSYDERQELDDLLGSMFSGVGNSHDLPHFRTEVTFEDASTR